MPRTTGLSIITSVDFYKEETNASTDVGAYAISDDGRGFRYVKGGAVALVNGNLLQAQAENVAFNSMLVQAAVAVNAIQIPVTLGASAATVNQFTGGVLVISSSNGIGQVFTILANTAALAASTCTFTVLEPVQVALTTTSTATVRANQFSLVIQQPIAHTGPAVGGAVHALTAGFFGWIQTHGMGAALSDATVTSATTMGLSPSVTTAGSVTRHVNQDQYVGRSLVAVNVSAQVYPIFWSLD